jgi:hypothetical protein
MAGSPSIAELFTHIHFVRLVFVFEDAPEFARDLPKDEREAERDPSRIAQRLDDSAAGAHGCGQPAPRRPGGPEGLKDGDGWGGALGFEAGFSRRSP